MRKGYVKISAIMTAMALMLTGCGTNYPDLSAEEEKAIAEYAAMLLLEYDANNRSRLIDREKIEETEATEETEEINQQEKDGEVQKETPVIELESETGTEMIARPEDFLGLTDGITFQYKEMEICDSYQAEGEADAYFTLDATPGKHLIVLKFGIENHSQTEQHIDIDSQNVSFRVTANGSYTRTALLTMLLDDMSTFVGDIQAGEVAEVVLLVEADADVADNISTLMLKMKNEEKTCTIQIK